MNSPMIIDLISNAKVCVPKPWGAELHYESGHRFVFKRLYIKPRSSLSFQYHEKKDELIYVEHGELLVRIGDIRNDKSISIISNNLYTAGEHIYIPAGTVHRFSSGDDSEAVLLEMSTPELDDIVRLQDDYGRCS